MTFKKLFTGLFILITISTFGETVTSSKKKEKYTVPSDSVNICINYLKKYIQEDNSWQAWNPEIMRTIKSLVHFAEDEKIDSVLYKLEKFQKTGTNLYVNRSPLQVNDSLQVAGFLPHKSILEKMKQLDRAIWTGVDMKSIPLPESLKALENQKKPPIAPGDDKAILERTGILLPDSLKNVFAIPDSLINTPNDFQRIRNRDQLRTKLLEEARVNYNNVLRKLNPDSAIAAYRNNAIKVYSELKQKQLVDSLTLKNQQILANYNDSVVRVVNDSIDQYVKILQRYAQNDSVLVSLQSLSGKPTSIWMQNNQQYITRMYIKNEQNDSIGVQIMNFNKHNLGIAIEDNVSFDRISQKQHRDFVFERFNPDNKLTKINKKYNIITPWDIGGNGTFGMTQTYLDNWKAGGKSSFSLLMVLKGFANYSNSKLKWENSGELRNGWIRQGGDLDQTQKNDDKIELISRLGVSAYKKWYYSAEIDFVSQFFNGYKYPNDSVPISAYMSPAKTLFKLGFDYKPNKNFSIFISPLTAKNVFVRDTAKIDQTKYGVSKNSRSFWEPGLNTDIRYKININPQISFETKYKMFMNYQDPFKKIDVSWENTLVAQLTDRINMTMMLYFLYDDNVTFDSGRKDAAGKAIFKPKLQTKELMTIGFSYKINKHIYKRKMIN